MELSRRRFVELIDVGIRRSRLRVPVDFSELLRGANIVANELSDTVLPQDNEAGLIHYDSKTVAVLCASSADFLFLYLGLTRLGFSSLHLAYAICALKNPSHYAVRRR